MFKKAGRSVATAMIPLLAMLAGALAGPVAAADRTGRIEVGGMVRSYSLHLPDAPRPAKGFPVILAFHGGGMQGPAMQRLTKLDSVADVRGVIVVYPNGIDKHWNDGRSTIRNPQDDVGFIAALLDKLEQDYPVDRAHIFATGISNGALFAERLGCDLSSRIAGIAPVAGTIPLELAPRCRPERPVAVLQIDGTGDPIMPYGGGAVADFGGKGEGGQVTSVTQTVADWARLNGCGSASGAQPLPPIAPFDRTRVVRMRYTGCRPGGGVTLLTVLGGGHTWPGGQQYAPRLFVGLESRQFDASRVMVDFFLSQSSRR